VNTFVGCTQRHQLLVRLHQPWKYGKINGALEFEEIKMNKKLIFGFALAVVFISGTFYSVHAARGDREREELSLMTPDVRDYFVTLSPREQEYFLTLAPWQWEYIVSLDPDDRYAYFELAPQERVIFFSMAPDFRIGFLGLVPEERHSFIILRPEERAAFFSQRHGDRAMSGAGKSRVQRAPAMKSEKEMSGRTRENGLSDTSSSSRQAGEVRGKGALGSSNNQEKTVTETRMKQQAPVRAEAERSGEVTAKKETKTLTDSHVKGESSGGHELDRGTSKAMSKPETARKSEPAGENNGGKGTREKTQ
jgi:hypothetical protein